MQEYIKKILGSGETTLIISNDETQDITKIVKSLEDSSWLLKGVSETIQNISGKGIIEQEKDLLELAMDPKDLQARIFNTSSCSWFWNIKVLSELT